jgi:beta-galactosidase
MLRCLLAAFAFASAAHAAPPPLWIEGESCTQTNAAPSREGWGAKERLSNKAWLSLAIEPDQVEKAIPAEGLTFSYPLEFAEAGQREVWFRLGYEFARTPFRFRIGDGFWIEVKPDQLTTDLMAIDDFVPVAWLNALSAEFPAGKQTLEIQIQRPEKTPKGTSPRVLFGLDAICIAPAFRPNGPFPPDAVWATPADEAARTLYFEFPAGDLKKPGQRHVLDLSGVWQFARDDEPGDVVGRTEPMELPKNLKDLFWRAIPVPGDKDLALPEMAYCHRYFYRARIEVPKTMTGRSFVVRFPNTALMTTVFVNGKRVGFNKAPCASFDCDATEAIKPGQSNEIVVGIKDLYYAVAKTAEGKSCRYLFDYPHERFHSGGGLGPTRFADFPVLGMVRRNGLLEAPQFIVGGSAYTSDLFCIPSVSGRKLDLEVTLRNPTAQPQTVDLSASVRIATPGSPPSLTFDPQPVTLPARGEQTIRLTKPWDSPRLWWPDDPAMYHADVQLAISGIPIDIVRQPFGFREWGIRGNSFTLNGIPWKFRADQRHAAPQEDPNPAFKEWKRNGQNVFRFRGEIPWTGRTQQATLDAFDSAGIAVRRSGIFDGEVASYMLVENGKVHQALFDNWLLQLEAWVKAERNHPSIHIWSLEHEITHTNARNFGWLPQVEPQVRKAAERIRKIDPTRPVMIDGGDALLDASLPVYGHHGREGAKRDEPDEAYTFAKTYARGTEPNRGDPWPIRDDKPLYLGKGVFDAGAPPASYAEVCGESAFLGRRAAAAGVARFARMVSEGYRWHGVAAFHLGFADGADAEHYKAWQPVCALLREWDSCWPAKSKIQRTIKVLNDSRESSPITVHWLLQTPDGVHSLRGSRQVPVEAGGAAEFAAEMETPDIAGAAAMEMDLTLACYRNGKEVFRDQRPIRVIHAPSAFQLNDDAKAVALFDPHGKASPALKVLTAFTPIHDWKAVPEGCRMLIVGPDAVKPEEATDPRWADHVRKGLKVLVLDQANPLHQFAVPADVECTNFSGSMAFLENPAHLAFAGMAPGDFFGRGPGKVVYRNAYRKPGKGARSLLQCDRELSCSALLECAHGPGLMLLCQVPTDDTPGIRLLNNLVLHAWGYKPAAKAMAAVLPPNDPRWKHLEATGAKFKPEADLAKALQTAEIVVADGGADSWAKIDPPAVKAFTAKGGTLVLWGLTPEGLPRFNELVGFNHAIRPFKMERVRLAARRDAWLAGIGSRDVALESTQRINPWAADRYPAAETFTHVVDLDDTAPFVQSKDYSHGWSQMTNGFTSADSWRFTFHHDQSKAGERPTWHGILPKEEEVVGVRIVPNADYRRITRLRIVFGDRPQDNELLTLKPEGELVQEFRFAKPWKCREIALEPMEWTDHAKPVIGIDNLEILAKRPADFAQRVVPLLNIGALVKYPQGKGAILLDQLHVPANESNPENAAKKVRLTANLLRNMGAEFAPERLFLPGINLAYTPVPLGGKCNGSLTKDQGWIDGQPDLAFLPAGERTFAGVRYDLPDFQTSPFPTVILLEGGKGIAAREVSGIPVGKKADAIFFLHAVHSAKAWTPQGEQDTPPVLYEYVVKYANGTEAVIPVRWGRDVAAWNPPKDAVRELPGASVAWQAPFPQGPADRNAVAYSMRWVNPKPEEIVESFGVRFPNGTPTGYGFPILFAATLADEKK